MKIGRKEAILALIASVIPWMGRRAGAQIQRLPPRGELQGPDINDLARRLAAVEAQLANQVAFTKDAYGNLSLVGSRNVSLQAGGNLNIAATSNADIRASGTATYGASGATKITGSTIALN